MPNNEKIAILISSCDAFSDLWEWHIKLLKQNWVGQRIPVYLVTDKPTEKSYEGVEIIVAEGSMDFPMRIKYATHKIGAQYVLLTLDDYFLIDKVQAQRIEYLLSRVETEKIDYLSLYNRRRVNPKRYTPIEDLETIDLRQKYAVTLYPAIWSADFLRKTVFEDLNAWQYEPTLTNTALKENANCQFSGAGTFVILDVVRKGKVLRKANSYFKKNGIHIGDRPLIGRATEIKLALMDFINWHAPKWVSRILKKIAKKMGMRFYSED